MEQQSKIANFNKQQALQEQAARDGLSGLASVSRHDFIEARMLPVADRLLLLLKGGKHQELQVLMNRPNWEAEEQTSLCPTMMISN